MNKFALFVLALLVALPQVASAQIYKWKDKDGTTRYSDTPPLGNVPYESLSGKKSAPAKPVADTAPAEAKPAAKPEAPQAEPKETPEQVQEKKRVEEENKKIRAQNCSTARANLQTYTQGGRISRMSEQGEREYLDDAALAKGAEQARKDIAEFCD
ncbi:MAG: DUF4124 domain-containing protein [Betaproteobacteria bacterium HGW-Betaproteobacteria-8]|nr:MAG: DUF4124 domain-containing protein [Betaproteobacteria bacterium HGW-Betaproteobacteria-8]